jgi:hypothetical protein
MIIRRLNDATIDVFTGNGWNNWSRFEVSYRSSRLSLKLVKGQPMKKEEYSKLYEELNK